MAVSLPGQGKHTEAAEIKREVLASTTRLLGADHEHTLATATNLASSLCQYGQKTKAVQILRETLALSQRALGPNHSQAHIVLQNLCGISRVVR